MKKNHMANKTDNGNRIDQGEWAEKLRKHFCIACIGGSTLRGQSTKGKNDRCRAFLKNTFLLEDLSKLNEKVFLKHIDSKTIELSQELPKPDCKPPNWGAARKAINIYLRLCVMNKDINSFYNLSSIEEYLEVPLDSETVRGIKKESKANLPSKFTIRNLAKTESDKFQEAARKVAKKKKIHRYELDVVLWNSEKL